VSLLLHGNRLRFAERPDVGTSRSSRQNVRDLTDDELAAMISIISSESGKILMPTVGATPADMHECAVELRKLAYTMPNGVGEHDLLQYRSR
jgi:hypothetical protein